MLSVLIPIYNFELQELVQELHRQLIDANVPFEILCLDDGSTAFYKNKNRLLTDLPQLNYQELPENVGRTRIRNLLAAQAQYEYLLFMDCDSRVVSPHYIRQYLLQLQPDTLLYGGRSYAPTPPDQSNMYLHWYYGLHREQLPATIRQRNPYHAFMTNNFLIPKAIFDQIKFDERLTQYGHEDTLFGMALQKRQVKIVHLDNPLEHIGLEKVDTFLQKTHQGIQNLAFLANNYPGLETRLLQAYRKLKKTRLLTLTQLVLHTIQPLLLWQLKSKQPKLKFFDWYKLQLFIDAMNASSATRLH